MNVTKRKTIDIDVTGQSVEITLHGCTHLDIVIRGDGAADYEVDIRGDDPGETWMQGVKTYSASADYNDSFQTGAAELRVRCSTASATSGHQADVLVSAGGK